MAIRPTEPMSIGAVLDTTFQLYKASVGRVLGLCVLLAIAGLPPSAYMLATGEFNQANPLAALAVMSDPLYWLVYLISILATLWILAALYLKIGAIGTQQALSAGASLRIALGRALPLFAMTILFLIALLIGTLLLVIPGLILMVSLLLCFNLALYEGKSPVQALLGSHRLVWGNWWRTAAILTVGFIIVMVFYVLAGVLLAVTLPFAGFARETVLFNMVASAIISALISVLATPFWISLIIAAYWDLKLRKEGADLADRVGALTAA